MGNSLPTSARGKLAVITGGAMGIGLAAAKKCAALGMKVVIADVKTEAGRAAEDTVRRMCPEAVVRFVRCDVTSPEAVQALHSVVYGELGGNVGFLFLNAGMSRDESFTAWKAPLSTWQAAFDVNVFGIVRCLQSFIPSLIDGGDCIVCTTSSYGGLINASIGAERGDPGGVSYVCSKHAVTVLTESLAHEMRTAHPHIGVSCLFPAIVATSFMDNADQAALEAALDEVGRAAKQRNFEDMSRNPIRQSWVPSGLTPDELIDLVLYPGLEAGRFYIRAFDRASSFDFLGEIITQRAKDIVEQRPAISYLHPNKDLSRPARMALGEVRQRSPPAKL